MLGGKALATGAGGASRQTQDPSADMWKNPVGNIGVKICQSLVGDARLRPENPFGMRELDAGYVGVGPRYDPIDISRLMSFGGLSSLKNLNDACRISPSWVPSRNSISQTRRGFLAK